MSLSKSFLRFARQRQVQRALLAMLLACIMVTAATLRVAQRRGATATARLNSATRALDALTDGSPEDDHQRAAIAWGYAERLRLGLESPFRLIEAAARDPRLKTDERRTVSWALLAHVLRGETHEIDAATLDSLGPTFDGKSAVGEQHLELITDAIARAGDPRAAELAVRMAYSLASAERLVEGPAPQFAAEVAALLADREVARREAGHVVRSTRGIDPIEAIRRRRARRSFYVERPVLLDPSQDIEREAIRMIHPLLESLRAMRPDLGISAEPATDTAQTQTNLAASLFDAGARIPPAAALVVAVRRYAPIVRAYAHNGAAFARVHNAEMLVAVAHAPAAGRLQRRAIGRLVVATAVAMRSLAQEPVWFPGDSSETPVRVATALGLAEITFDREVPSAWRPYYLRSLSDGVRDLRRVLPTLRLDAVRVRFRMNAPADSALAMHDPRSRTVHLPVLTAGGTLTHELAHDLDRRSAEELGLPGYRSDNVARAITNTTSPRNAGSGRLAASLRALTEEVSDIPRAARPQTDRPAEIFATQVDWFVAKALARHGIAGGYLSAVQDELLTGHVVHPDRLRNVGRTRSLLTALTEMTAVASFAAEESEPSLQALLRWSLTGPVDRRVAAAIVRGDRDPWAPGPLIGERSCEEEESGRVELIRMAAESRARGWLRMRARWTPEAERAPWARAVLVQGPWSSEMAERRIAELRDYVLVQLGSGDELPAGLGAYAAPLVVRARCSN